MSKEKKYKEIIKKNLKNTISYGFIHELVTHKSGKVRDVHFTSDKVGSPIVMVASDRVSSFDYVLNKRVPFKGKVLNLFSRWAFENTQDIVPNAMIESPHSNVIIQKRMKKIQYEFVVRGYVWGSMAADYEAGNRVFCGHKLSDSLLRYQKLDEPMFTPATKAEDGDHDINVSYEYLAKGIGEKLASQLRDIAVKLYKRGAELAEKRGYIFIDTKYEFGLDDHGKPYLIDEANTPDSSRYCSIDEYKKFSGIKKEMDTGKYKDVTEMLKSHPELKIKELSKQFVREVLIEKGFSYGSSGAVPKLQDDDVVEVAWRYIHLYEELTGLEFPFTSGPARQDMLEALKAEGLIKGGLCIIMAGSDSDMPHIEKIQKGLEDFGIPSKVRICSAHKQSSRCETLVKMYNDSLEPIVIVAVAGGTDALSGTASFHSVHPVISCPPDKEEYASCLKNPPGSSNSLILHPSNCARHVAQILGLSVDGVQDKILEANSKKIAKLEKADG